MLSNILKSLVFNEQSDSYLVIEGSFKYEFPSYLVDDFKHYIFRFDLVSRWYKHLDENDMLKVKRTIAYE